MSDRDVQRRYTDKELITLLQILGSDYNRKPTQRDILNDDRLPTHHTYSKRFGGVNEALEAAGIYELEESALHGATKSIFEYYGVQIVGEWVPTGPIIVDFVVRDANGELHHIDIVEMKGTKIEKEIAGMRHTLATPYAKHYKQIKDIGDAIALTDPLSGGAVVADIGGE